MMDTGYTVTVSENGAKLDRRSIADPFIHTRIRPQGWRQAIQVLLGHYEVTVAVGADRATVERVLELDADYLGLPGSDRRKAWEAELNRALGRFAEQE